MSISKYYNLDVLRISALNSRVRNTIHISDTYQNIKAGFSGEEKVISYINEVHLTGGVRTFRNINLDNTQIDVIVVTSKFICILEVKNMTGEFYFDPVSKHFYRIKNEKKEGMRNPELQLRRAVRVLQHRLDRKGLDIPVRGLIIFASRAGIVMQPPTLFPAIPIDAMGIYLEEMDELSGQSITSEEMKKIRHILMKSDLVVHEPKLFERLGIDRSEVKPGVRCTGCFEVGMKRVYSSWICSKCGVRDKNAHFATLQEYQLLFGREITSRDMKRWLQIDDRFLVLRILKHAHESYQFGPKNRVYKLKFEPLRLEGFLASEMKKW